jgi:hypothetical protein
MITLSDIESTTLEIENSTLETIYWWNRTESYYHKYFSQLDRVCSDNVVFDFFVSKIFQVFLGEYSIRRNIAAGENSPKIFLEQLLRKEFYNRVISGDTSVIDELSSYFKNESITNNRETRSLLSKIAFLINPIDFSLLDSYAKDSLWDKIKSSKTVSRQAINTYTGFIDQINIYMDANHGLFSDIHDTLSHFENTDAFSYFNDNPDAFKRRVFDKYLWISIARKNGRVIDNSGYRSFINFQ